MTTKELEYIAEIFHEAYSEYGLNDYREGYHHAIEDFASESGRLPDGGAP